MYIAQTDSWYLERITVLIKPVLLCLTTVIFAWVHSPSLADFNIHSWCK